MKKRIFIAIHYLEIGGAEISLIGLLNSIDFSKYEVDLMIYSHQGELMKFVPNEVNILPEISAYSYIEKPLIKAFLAGQWGIVLGRLIGRFKYNYYLKKTNQQSSRSIFQYVMNGVEPFLPSLKKKACYDLAISFLTPHNIVLHKVKAKKKICWIHTDYSTLLIHKELELPIWKGFDHIVSISPAVSQSFLQVFPTLANKITEMENILSTDFIRERAELISEEIIRREIPKKNKVLIFLSIGRFMDAKNFDNVPAICKILNETGYSVNWYLIGYGIDEPLIRMRIKENNMQDKVILLGKKENPYPYIKACDFYIQPSRYEGKSITVREAQILYKPVVIANYKTAKDQVKDGVDGIIVPQDNENCAKGIIKFINDKKLQNSIVDYLKNNDYGNKNEIYKLYKLLA